MKNLISMLILTIAFNQLNAQSIHRSVIGSAGMTTTVGNVSLSSTTGEAITSTFSNANLLLTQGFQQGDPVINVPMYFIFYLQGYYSTNTHTMNSVLFNQGKSSDMNIVDSVEVELHPVNAPSLIAASAKMLLSTAGLANTNITTKPGDYYPVFKHRNTIATWSAIPYQFNGAPILIDFSYQAQRAYGSNQIEVEPGVWAFYSGDVNHDDNIDLLDIGIVESDIDQFLFGYYATDINGDGNVDLLDVPTVENNVNEFVYSIHP